MAHQPIENYGVVGNMRTVALIGMNGSVDWACSPQFDSPSIFGAILDQQKGGYFKICPAEQHGITYKQLYWPETNVLVTRFLSVDGVAEIIDFMPVDYHGHDHNVNQLIRRVNIVKGSMALRMECFPAFNYARDSHEIHFNEAGCLFSSATANMQLSTTLPMQPEGSGVTCDFVLQEGQTITFSMSQAEADEDEGYKLTEAESQHLFEDTVEFWQKWLSQSTYRGRWREMVERSALALKLLTYEPTGAIVAAPTSSLPQGNLVQRNWDHRYTWIRDAAFTIYAFLRIGFTQEAAKFMGWIEARAAELDSDGSLQNMYGIDGRHQLNEETLSHLQGYEGYGPVRVGNSSYDQRRLDIYGELMDSVYLYNKYGSPISYDFWTHLSRLTDWVVDNWRSTDEGIWEVPGGRRHFVYSKLMCWVAIDRAIRLADKRSFPADRARWHTTRDQIYQEIMAKGWSDERQSFVQSYDSETLDASLLMMPLVFFMSPTDPRMLKTLEAIDRPPSNGGLVSNSLVYRYSPDSPIGLDGYGGSANICTFWLVEALTRAGQVDRRHLDRARLVFEKMLSYGNHLGLFAEEIGPSGEALGNFPQAFTHLGLISAAVNLDRHLGTIS